MAELLFHMEKLRGLMRKYNQVVQRYHVQYLAQFDALLLNDTIQVPVDNVIMCVCEYYTVQGATCTPEHYSQEYIGAESGRKGKPDNVFILECILYFSFFSINSGIFISSAEHVCLSRRGVCPDEFIRLDPVCSLNQTR